MTAAPTVPPSPRTDTAANCADPANVVADMTIGASHPKPAARASTPNEIPKPDDRDRERADGAGAVPVALGLDPDLPAHPVLGPHRVRGRRCASSRRASSSRRRSPRPRRRADRAPRGPQPRAGRGPTRGQGRGGGRTSAAPIGRWAAALASGTFGPPSAVAVGCHALQSSVQSALRERSPASRYSAEHPRPLHGQSGQIGMEDVDDADPRPHRSVVAGLDERPGTGPLYRRLAEAIRAAIRRGELPSGTRLPTERALAVELSVSRSTVVAAYDLLRGEGWLESRQGSGTWVRRHAAIVRFGEDRPGFVGRRRRRSERSSRVRARASSSRCAALAAGDLFARSGDGACARGPRVVRARSAIGYEAVGHPPLRAAIADHLSRRWRLPTTTEEVIVTTGAQQAVGLAAALYARPGEVALVEDPTYLTAIDVFTAAGVRLLPVPIGVQGVRPERLREAMVDAAPGFAYLMPTFHNPTGASCPNASGARSRTSRRTSRCRSSRTSRSPTSSLDERAAAADRRVPGRRAGPDDRVAVEDPVGRTADRLDPRAGAGDPAASRRMKLVMDHGTSTVSQILALPLLEDLDAILDERRALVRERRADAREPARASTCPRGRGTTPAGRALPVGATAARRRDRVRARRDPPRRDGRAGPMTSVDGNFADRVRLPFVLEPDQMREGDRAARARLGRVRARGRSGPAGRSRRRLRREVGDRGRASRSRSVSSTCSPIARSPGNQLCVVPDPVDLDARRHASSSRRRSDSPRRRSSRRIDRGPVRRCASSAPTESSRSPDTPRSAPRSSSSSEGRVVLAGDPVGPAGEIPVEVDVARRIGVDVAAAADVRPRVRGSRVGRPRRRSGGRRPASGRSPVQRPSRRASRR